MSLQGITLGRELDAQDRVVVKVDPAPVVEHVERELPGRLLPGLEPSSSATPTPQGLPRSRVLNVARVVPENSTVEDATPSNTTGT